MRVSALPAYGEFSEISDFLAAPAKSAGKQRGVVRRTMVGDRQDSLAGLAFPEIFHTVPAAICALSGVDALANLIVELQHCEGWTVRARMRKSALMRRDDPVVLVNFENSTERLWMDER